MFAAERGALKSIQAWQSRGGSLDTLLVHQVRPPLPLTKL